LRFRWHGERSLGRQGLWLGRWREWLDCEANTSLALALAGRRPRHALVEHFNIDLPAGYIQRVQPASNGFFYIRANRFNGLGFEHSKSPEKSNLKSDPQVDI
jgi:hypothetical protein